MLLQVKRRSNNALAGTSYFAPTYSKEEFQTFRSMTMDYKTFDFAVIGGDMRQVYLAMILAGHGYKICQYALCGSVPKNICTPAHTLQEAVAYASAVIAPIPMTKDKKNIHHSSTASKIPLPLLADYLSDGQYFFAGCIPEHFRDTLLAQNVHVHDLMEDESLAIYNTIATAEGAVSEALQKSSRNLHRSRCLILGYGRCGKTLTSLLKGMSCHTAVYARRPETRAEAAVVAEETADEGSLQTYLKESDFIFNTVPSLILDRKRLESTKKDCVIIDIASAPGGVDYPAALELGISAHLCPGLPGRCAPLSSAEAIRDAILKNI